MDERDNVFDDGHLDFDGIAVVVLLFFLEKRRVRFNVINMFVYKYNVL